MYDLRVNGWENVSGGSFAGGPEDVVQVCEPNAPTLASSQSTSIPAASDDCFSWASQASRMQLRMYNAEPLQDAKEHRQRSQDRLKELQREHDRLLEKALNVIEPTQAVDRVSVKEEPIWCRPPLGSSQSLPASPRGERDSLWSPLSTPRKQAGIMPLGGFSTPPSSSRGAKSSPSLMGSRRTRAASMSTEDQELRGPCSFAPAIRSRLRSASSDNAVTHKPTKTSILREEAIWMRQESLRESQEAASSTLSRQSSVESRLARTTSKDQQRVLEEKLAEIEGEGLRNAQRRADAMLSFKAGSEVRAFESQLKRIMANDQKSRSRSALEERRQQDECEMLSRQQSVQQLRVERQKSAERVKHMVQQSSALQGECRRDERRRSEDIVYQEEQLLLEQRRSHVRKMHELENERARLLQAWREKDIQTKRSQLMKLRKDLEEQHQCREKADSQQLDDKRTTQKRERARKYEDLLGRAQHLEHLRELDRALNDQIRSEYDSMMQQQDLRQQQAREQAMLEMETRFMERRQQLLLQEDAFHERLKDGSLSSPKGKSSRKTTPESSRKETPKGTPEASPRLSARKCPSPRSGSKMITGSPFQSDTVSDSPRSDRSRPFKTQTSCSSSHTNPPPSSQTSPPPTSPKNASPGSSSRSVVERLLSKGRSRTLTTRAQDKAVAGSPKGDSKSNQSLATTASPSGEKAAAQLLASNGSEASISTSISSPAASQATLLQAIPSAKIINEIRTMSGIQDDLDLARELQAASNGLMSQIAAPGARYVTTSRPTYAQPVGTNVSSPPSASTAKFKPAASAPSLPVEAASSTAPKPLVSLTPSKLSSSVLSFSQQMRTPMFAAPLTPAGMPPPANAADPADASAG